MAEAGGWKEAWASMRPMVCQHRPSRHHSVQRYCLSRLVLCQKTPALEFTTTINIRQSSCMISNTCGQCSMAQRLWWLSQGCVKEDVSHFFAPANQQASSNAAYIPGLQPDCTPTRNAGRAKRQQSRAGSSGKDLTFHQLALQWPFCSLRCL